MNVCACMRAYCASGDFVFVFLQSFSIPNIPCELSKFKDPQGPDNQPRSSSSRRDKQNNTVRLPPVANFSSATISFRLNVVKNLIERCMQLYMTRNQVIDTLFEIARIERSFTEIVWQRLERDNRDFFEAYYVRLRVIEQVNTFNHLLQLQNHMTKPCPSGLQVEQSPPGLPTGNPGDLLEMQMNSWNDARAVRNENVATNSQYLHLPSDMSGSLDSAYKSHFERIPQSQKSGWDGEPKSSSGVLTSNPTAHLSNLPGNPAIQQRPIIFPVDPGYLHDMQMNSWIARRMVQNENAASNSQYLLFPSDMSRGFYSASKSQLERNTQSLMLGLDGDPKGSAGVLTPYPTADRFNLPGYKASLISVND
ncbi:hypothetical protein FNV43_RR23961 [Rhamnella rubrinervis]|uniref:Uncharacterized protein n=1 Tax=Rhamnella rubrinervis TaxID=2594499 RepID=A0A8K0DRK5_9ROSA|nr:hypothetical protein FNV43_RR23961 [Rhamnella rubrinervis]